MHKEGVHDKIRYDVMTKRGPQSLSDYDAVIDLNANA